MCQCFMLGRGKLKINRTPLRLSSNRSSLCQHNPSSVTSRVFHHLQPCFEKNQISIPASCRAADCFQTDPTPPLQTQTMKEQRRVIAHRHGASLGYSWSGLKFVLSFPTRTIWGTLSPACWATMKTIFFSSCNHD